VATEARFDRTSDGRIWSDGSFSHSFWERYLDVFDTVGVVARVRDVDSVPTHALPADGPGVSFSPVPYFVGPWQFAARFFQVIRAVRGCFRAGYAVILRVPGTIGSCLEPRLRFRGHPYGVEVTGDPREVFAPGSVRTVLRPFLSWWFPHGLRRQCLGACAVSYVSPRILPKRYPASPEAFSTYYSSIQLTDDAFVERPAPVKTNANPYELLLVGSLDQLYKGPDVAIDALAENIATGLDLRLTIVGDGVYRPELEAHVSRLHLVDRVRFAGRLPAGDPVRAELDRADLFLLPSLTEGLPRALIEAQARGLPCVATDVGGIPDLLSPEDLVQPRDPVALARKTRDVLADPQRRARMAARNLETADDYRLTKLQIRRRRFYRAVLDATQRFLGGTRG